MNLRLFQALFTALFVFSEFALAQPQLTPNRWVLAKQIPDSDAVDDIANCNGIPCDRAWFPLEYHAGVGRIILYGGGVSGGCGSGYVNDVWEVYYDQAKDGWRWNQRLGVNRQSGWPQGMDNQVMTYDAINQYMWILGGTCGGGFGFYDYATNSFTEVGDYNTQDGDEHFDGVFDPGFAWANGQLVVFSGEASWVENPGLRTSTFDTSKVTPDGWKVALSPSGAPGREQIEEVMVYIPTTNRFLIFGGQPTGKAGSGSNDTWEYDPTANKWSEVVTNPTPPPRQQHVMVYDSANDVVIMHGGSGRGDTWIYDPHTKVWKELRGANGPIRRLHGAAYDIANNVMIMWSGKDENGNDSLDMFALRYQPSGATSDNIAPSGINDVVAQ